MIKMLAIIGNGGHTQDIRMIIRDMEATKIPSERRFQGVVCLDDNQDRSNSRGNGIYDQYLRLMAMYGKEVQYVIGINDSVIREEIDTNMQQMHAVAAGAIIHPTALFKGNGGLGNGVILGPYTVLGPDVSLGRHVHMNTGASINQGSKIGDFCTLSPGVRVCGDVTVGKTVQFGASSTIINMITVGDNVILGAGTVVVEDIPSGVTAYGVPARVKEVPK